MEEPKIIVRGKNRRLDQLPGSIPAPDSQKPQALGSGIIKSRLSTGGMAVIYEIWNSQLEVPRAVKLLRPDHTRETLERFQTEMKISAKLHHPNIVEIYAVGKWKDLPFIEMEMIDGVTLEKLIAERGALPLKVCTSIGIMIGRALNYAHSRRYVIYGNEYEGVIHRDLKPSNVMITNSGVVKLMDFGVARPVTASIHTCADTVVGTLQYLSPEQLDGKEIDRRSDIYTLGAVVYEMLTGKQVFPDPNLGHLIPAKLHNKYTPLERYRIKIPRSLRALVHRCMRLEKGERVQNALEYLRILGRIHKRITHESPEQVLRAFVNTQPGPRSTPCLRGNLITTPNLLVGLGIVILGGMLGFAGWELFHTQAPSSPTVDSTKTNDLLTQLIERETDDATGKNDSATERESRAVDSLQAPPPETESLPRDISQREKGTDSETRKTTKKKQSAANGTPPRRELKSKETSSSRTHSSMDRLIKEYRTDDLLRIFVAEVEGERFASALQVAEHLTPRQARTNRAILYKIRCLAGAGKRTKLAKLLAMTDVDDGEFYLEKARFYFVRGNLNDSRRYLERAATTATEFLDSKTFRERHFFLTAQCETASFEKDPNEDTKAKAMAAWYNLKSLLRHVPEHKWFKKADNEIRRISRHKVP